MSFFDLRFHFMTFNVSPILNFLCLPIAKDTFGMKTNLKTRHLLKEAQYFRPYEVTNYLTCIHEYIIHTSFWFCFCRVKPGAALCTTFGPNNLKHATFLNFNISGLLGIIVQGETAERYWIYSIPETYRN